MKLDFLEKRLSLAQRRPLIANLYPLPPGRGGALLEIHGRGVMPGSPTPNSVRPKTVIFHTRFQTCAQKSKPVFSTWRRSENATYIHVYIDRNYVIIAEIRAPTKRFLKIHFEFACYTLVLTQLELKRRIHSYTTVVPS